MHVALFRRMRKAICLLVLVACAQPAIEEGSRSSSQRKPKAAAEKADAKDKEDVDDSDDGDLDDGDDNKAPGGTTNATFFAADSPWNVKATGKVDPKTNVMVSSDQPGSFRSSFKLTGKKGLAVAGTDDYPDYGVPLVEADAATPKVAVKDKYGWWPGFDAAPIPANAKPAIGTDQHLSVYDKSTNTLWELWEAVKNPDGSWSAGAGVKLDAKGSGFQTKPWALSARAYGGALVAGAILKKEMEAGKIEHALGMAFNMTRGTSYALGMGTDGITQNIASHCDNSDKPERNGEANLPEGVRLRLKSSVDLAAKCGAGRACKVIGEALRTYGMYVVDTAAVATLYAQILPDQSWGDLLHITDAEAFGADDFELLSLPAALTNAP